MTRPSMFNTNFRGFSFIPSYNTVVSYSNTSDKYDEGSKDGGQA